MRTGDRLSGLGAVLPWPPLSLSLARVPQAVGLSRGGHFSVVDASTWQATQFGRPLFSDALACTFIHGGRRCLVGGRNGHVLQVDLLGR